MTMSAHTADCVDHYRGYCIAFTGFTPLGGLHQAGQLIARPADGDAYLYTNVQSPRRPDDSQREVQRGIGQMRLLIDDARTEGV